MFVVKFLFVQSLGHVTPMDYMTVFICSIAALCDPWNTAHQASLSFIISQSLLKLMFIESVMLSTISSSVFPFSFLQSFPASGFFPMSQLFTSGGQSIGVLASVLPTNTQDWFPLGLTGLISLQSKDSPESSQTPQFQSISSLALSSLYGPTLTSYMTTGKIIALIIWTFLVKVISLLFNTWLGLS